MASVHYENRVKFRPSLRSLPETQSLTPYVKKLLTEYLTTTISGKKGQEFRGLSVMEPL